MPEVHVIALKSQKLIPIRLYPVFLSFLQLLPHLSYFSGFKLNLLSSPSRLKMDYQKRCPPNFLPISIFPLLLTH